VRAAVWLSESEHAGGDLPPLGLVGIEQRVRRAGKTAAGFHPKFHASCTLAFNPWLPVGG
jgi:hypothetical protein